jgi:hypothetical protein
MLILWKVHWLDGKSRCAHERILSLDTETLEPAVKAAVELVIESCKDETDKRIIKFRHLFHDKQNSEASDPPKPISFKTFCIPYYFEDETGDELSMKEAGQALSGDSNSILLPSGMKEHDVEYMFAEKKQFPKVSLSNDDFRSFSSFVRDLQELNDTALMKNGAGSLTGVSRGPSIELQEMNYESSLSHEEVRSAIMVFRRLYMPSEPGTFLKVADAFNRISQNHPVGKWVLGTATELHTTLKSAPFSAGALRAKTITFSTKRLIDVFLNTQYAHQPDKQGRNQYKRCVEQVEGRHDILLWMFLSEVAMFGRMVNAFGKNISGWFHNHCDTNALDPNFVVSVGHNHSGFQKLEKPENRKKRVQQEKEAELANALWKAAGEPSGGPTQFSEEAQAQLQQAMPRS